MMERCASGLRALYTQGTLSAARRVHQSPRVAALQANRRWYATADAQAAAGGGDEPRQGKRRMRRAASPEQALKIAPNLTAYRKLRKLHQHMPISYFPELMQLPGEPAHMTKRRHPGLQEALEKLEAEEVATQAQNTEWQIKVAVCFERYPRLTRDPTPEEVEWGKWAEKIHIEKSAQLKVELDWLEKKEKEEERKAQGLTDFGAEAAKFVPQDRTTKADEANDQTSVQRKLQEKLYLLTQSADGWSMPQTTVAGDESLRQAAERCITGVVEPDTEVYFIGNAPSFCRTVLFDGKDEAGFYGDKVFFYRAVLVSPEPAFNAEYANKFLWLNKSEVGEQNADLYSDIAPILF